MEEPKPMIADCGRCGCTKPCGCDNYTPPTQETCVRCGCTKPCSCDSYTQDCVERDQ
jgi:hypothetical protein